MFPLFSYLAVYIYVSLSISLSAASVNVSVAVSVLISPVLGGCLRVDCVLDVRTAKNRTEFLLLPARALYCLVRKRKKRRNTDRQRKKTKSVSLYLNLPSFSFP
jgi:hypothetical protein